MHQVSEGPCAGWGLVQARVMWQNEISPIQRQEAANERKRAVDLLGSKAKIELPSNSLPDPPIVESRDEVKTQEYSRDLFRQ